MQRSVVKVALAQRVDMVPLIRNKNFLRRSLPSHATCCSLAFLDFRVFSVHYTSGRVRQIHATLT